MFASFSSVLFIFCFFQHAPKSHFLNILTIYMYTPKPMLPATDVCC